MTSTKLHYADLCEIHGQKLVDAQIRLEQRMAGMGTEEFYRKLANAREKGRESATMYGKHLLASSIDAVAAGIRAFLEKAMGGGAGRRHAAAAPLSQVEPEVAALLALRVILNYISSDRSYTTTARAIAERIEAELRFQALAEDHTESAEYVKRKAQKSQSDRHTHAVLSATMSKAGVEWEGWSDTTRVLVGSQLVSIVIETTGLITTLDVADGPKKTRKKIRLSEDAAAWIAKQEARCELLTPQHMPTLIQPAMWSDFEDGGYHTLAVPQIALVKGARRSYVSQMNARKDEMQIVFDSINALQATAWRINRRVYGVARALWDRGEALAKLPSRDRISSVQCPKCGANVPLGKAEAGRRRAQRHACFEDNEELLKSWKKDAARAHEANTKSASKQLLVQRTLKVADDMRKHPAIYFPYQLDFRGRIYAVPPFSPQGHDLNKGLLEFADGKAISTENGGVQWLAIHGANVYGEDKISLQERVDWVRAHDDMILQTAEDPIGMVGWWGEADKPWQFLAFCFEWAEWLEVGDGFVSYLPVALDGSCSGIQHFSAMLRDEVGGSAVNLTPGQVPADIYAAVCRVVIEKLEADTRKRNQEGWLEKAQWAQQILDLAPDRKMTKRQVMTMVYGATQQSCRAYTRDWLQDERGNQLPWKGEELSKVVTYLGGLIWASIGEVVIAAREAMDWLQGCAKAVAENDAPIRWTTPIGFVVEQRYPKMSSKLVRSSLGDKVVKMSVQTPHVSKIDRRRMTQGISPNFVHSMDAAHLMWSVWYAKENGIDSFSMIHDSFGTHAADAEMLGACLREAFVDMYKKTDILERFREQLVEQGGEHVSERLPEMPPKGRLDLDTVRDSDFFFA